MMNKHLLSHCFHTTREQKSHPDSTNTARVINNKKGRAPCSSVTTGQHQMTDPRRRVTPAILAARVTVISFTTGKVTFLNNVNIHSAQTQHSTSYTVHTSSLHSEENVKISSRKWMLPHSYKNQTIFYKTFVLINNDTYKNSTTGCSYL